MTTQNKEKVYDEQISPLMLQIIKICQANGIAMLATFYIPTPDQESLRCTTLIPDGEKVNGPGHELAACILMRECPSIVGAVLNGDEQSPDFCPVGTVTH